MVLKTLFVVIILVICSISISVGTQAPMDVPRDHWAYQAVNELAQKGLVLGYPDGSFLGDRTLTRYEFATIIARILSEIDNKAADVKPAKSGNDVGITERDLADIKKLAYEFKVELTIIGARLDKLEANVAELRTQIDAHSKAIKENETAVQTAGSDIDKLKKVALSGYVQARYQTINFDKENESEDDSSDTFLVRRARVKVTANPSPKSAAVLQLDLGKNAVSVKDAYLQLAFGKNSADSSSFIVGQQHWWFGYEVPYSSSRRETPERALFVRRFFPGERDQGAVIQSAADKQFIWRLGVYNGTGTEDNSSSDLNDAKDVLVNAKWNTGRLSFGISGYHGRGVWSAFGDPSTYLSGVEKSRYGADLQYYMKNITLKAEYIGGKGFDEADPSWNQNETVNGYYAQLNYNINPRNILVARYASMSQDPVSPQYGRRSAWDLGAIRWLDDKSRLKVFYKINNEENEVDTVSQDNNGLAFEWITVY